jgi:IstB-like ATP binding protein
MHLVELERSLRQLRLGGIAAVLETRLRQAQAEPMAPIDLIACLVSDELTRRADRLLERRRKQARFRDPDKTLDNFDFSFNPKMNRSLVFDLATGAFIAKREDALFLGPGGTGKSHLAQAIGKPPFCRVTKCCTGKFTSCSMSCPMPLPKGRAKSTSSRWPPFRCLSWMTSACANCPTQPQRICWRLSCAATNGSARY